MVSAVSSVVASRELDGDSGEYGFDAPSLTVVVKYSDSTEYTVKLGNVNSFNSSMVMDFTSVIFCYFLLNLAMKKPSVLCIPGRSCR